MPRPRTIHANWYDYPGYYDLAFGDETKMEASFIEAACRKYLKGAGVGKRSGGGRYLSNGKHAGNGKPSYPSPLPEGEENQRLRLLEPACGSGRLLIELVKRGHEVVGFDLGEKAVQYVQQKLAKAKLPANVFQADMTDFRVKGKFDAAFNLISTFRHLTTRRQAIAHLRCVANSLRVGGIYVLGLILVPEDTDESEAYERWTRKRGTTRVTVTLTVPQLNLPERWEIMRTSLVAKTPKEHVRIVTEDRMGVYTPGDMRSLFRAVPEFEVLDTFDFWYEIDQPTRFDDRYGDVVFLLRKKRVAGQAVGRPSHRTTE